MPSLYVVEDKGTLPHLVTLAGIGGKFSNIKKKIVRCGNYEFHHQHHQSAQIELLLNMFDNYVVTQSINLTEVKTKAQAEELMVAMLRFYGALWYWDPTYVDPMGDRKCDLFLSSRDQVIRLVLDLCLSQCERENDCDGLRMIRRIMVPYFRNKSREATSLYARYMLIDLVMELSASERTRTRMNQLVCVNPSGLKGGFMFRDKYNEEAGVNKKSFTC